MGGFWLNGWQKRGGGSADGPGMYLGGATEGGRVTLCDGCPVGDGGSVGPATRWEDDLEVFAKERGGTWEAWALDRHTWDQFDQQYAEFRSETGVA